MQVRLAQARHIGDDDATMRRDEFAPGSFVHIVKRGTRGTSLVRDVHDRERFLLLLRYLNDAKVPRNWERDIAGECTQDGYTRPAHWPEAEPYVSLVSFCLMDNHFHLLVRENTEGGISKFMQRVCTSMAAYFNARHNERGTLFESAYWARTVKDDDHLQYLRAYIEVKNTLELYPHGFSSVLADFSRAFDWAQQYAYSSLFDSMSADRRILIDHSLVAEMFGTNDAYRRFAEDVIFGRYRSAEEDEEWCA